MLIRIYNQTGLAISYLGGDVIAPAFPAFVDVPEDYNYEIARDAQFRSDITLGNVQVNDGITNYGTIDAIAYLDLLVGLTDSDGKGITSTTVVTGVIEHQALDVNIVSGTSTGAVDNSSFTYSDSVQQTIGGVYNDTGSQVNSGSAAAARITEYRAIHVNLRDSSGSELGGISNPVNIEGTINTNIGTRVNSYNEVTGIVQGITTLVGSYNPLSNKYLEKVYFSGTNIAEFELVINGSTVDKKRTAHGGSFNECFDFGLGLSVLTGQLIELYVVHNRPFNGDFNVRFQLLEV